ncbi:MAG: hypothetical protein A3F31_03725 [Candidatus Levybacteria bacterium RIFCSPHIGHO2_12_FULL_38_12]|nr:MAG: hypothetical protein A3F31_03725 [Candidatus Levybacteria bacterium RIFCSPHIGHO2_12_FULL_38_12]OGH33532.1 MAG: hypothetical protein A3A47_01685 [Candidatus Levybacteria bacterium RIFCSPLOWO2_01_FULL_37_20]
MIWGLPKKVFIYIVSAIVIVGLITSIFVYSKIKPSKPAKKTSVVVSKELKEYRDTSGFMFKFPQNIQLKKNENVNNKTYSDIALFSSQSSGMISIKIEDTQYNSLEEWKNKKKDIISSGSPKPIFLSGMNAMEATTKDGITAASIDNNVLYIIQVSFKDNRSFWQDVYAAVVSTFSRF